MEEEVPFEAEHVLQELYNLDAVVQGVQAGTWERYFMLFCFSLQCLQLQAFCISARQVTTESHFFRDAFLQQCCMEDVVGFWASVRSLASKA